MGWESRKVFEKSQRIDRLFTTTMKRFIIKLFSVVLQFMNRIAVWLGLSRPKVIIYMDGGICSQMSMYLKGQYYKEVADVLYDTTWFELNGKDLDGRFDRKLELTKLFPTLDFKTVRRKEKRFYKMFYSYPQSDGYLPEPDTINRITYFGGYFEMKQEDKNRLFSSCFSSDRMREPDVQLPDDGVEGAKIAVHVRRGDLANRENQWYKKVPVSYFLNAIDYVKGRFENIQLFFFSDEPEWVEENLCPYITTSYYIIRGNKAYEDLYLISLCDVVVASQGSFGVWGARLNGHSTLIKPSYESEGGFIQVAPLL